MAHICNYYCAGTVHAFSVLAPSDVPAADHEPQFRRLYAARGYRLLRLRPAPEAALAQFQATASQGGYPTPSGRIVFRHPRHRDFALCTVPLLALVETAPAAEEG